MIYLSIKSASASIKEHVEVNGSVTPDITSELKLLLECYAQFLGFSLTEAIEVVMGFSNGESSCVVWLLNFYAIVQIFCGDPLNRYVIPTWIQMLHNYCYRELNWHNCHELRYFRIRKQNGKTFFILIIQTMMPVNYMWRYRKMSCSRNEFAYYYRVCSLRAFFWNICIW